MSLLMDALKKAEEAKRSAAEHKTTGTAAFRDLELAPLDSPKAPTVPDSPSRIAMPPGVSPLPDLSLHIESVDADLAAVSKDDLSQRRTPKAAITPPYNTAPKAANARPQDNSEQAAARNVFSVKQPSEPRSALWFILPMGGLAALGIGAYFWWQLQAISGGSLSPLKPKAATSPTQADSKPAPLAQRPPVAESAATGAATSEASASEAAKPAPESTPVTNPRKAETTANSPETIVQEPTRPARNKSVATASPAASDSRQFNLTRTQPKQNPTIEQAYDALQAGHFNVAQRAYQQVLRGDPKNTDALLGLATLAARQGDTGRAQSYYLQALESNPNDATAQAGVIQARGQSDPAQSESRLKSALAAQPDSPALQFALGNFYAREQRWSEAQQAYFGAYSTEPDNPEFIFNLAVSLDQLHQNKLAAQYYQMALNTADASRDSRAVAFDHQQVQNRIQELLP